MLRYGEAAIPTLTLPRTSAYPCYLTVISKLLQHILGFNQIAMIPSDTCFVVIITRIQDS